MRQKAPCLPAGDCCVIRGAVNAAGHLILTLANNQQVDVGLITPPLYAARLLYSGGTLAVAPNTQVIVPFNTLVHNYGNVGSLATFGFTAPFACLVHVAAYTFWAFEAWSSSGAVAGATFVAKNGVAVAEIGADYSIKGGTLISGNGNELKFAQGAVDIECAAGDVLTIKAANGQSAGATHNVFQADASFHIVGAI